MYDLLVKNGKIVTADAVFDGNIAVKNGKIAALMSAGEEPEAARSSMQRKLCVPGRSIRMRI
ncbi:hypothetical protein [Enterocloster sp.]|uniref:hypothetical protein n=1 Tax=Enterocloster sp. TaxID=2719315 RepID=UPI0039A346DD